MSTAAELTGKQALAAIRRYEAALDGCSLETVMTALLEGVYYIDYRFNSRTGKTDRSVIRYSEVSLYFSGGGQHGCLLAQNRILHLSDFGNGWALRRSDLEGKTAPDGKDQTAEQ